MKYYILKDNMAVESGSLMDWAEWMNSANRSVARTEIDGTVVSTVFLGLDHNFFGEGDPLLFESLVFLDEGDTGQMARYFTWAEAKDGHTKIVNILQKEHAEAHLMTVDILAALLVNARSGV